MSTPTKSPLPEKMNEFGSLWPIPHADPLLKMEAPMHCRLRCSTTRPLRILAMNIQRLLQAVVAIGVLAGAGFLMANGVVPSVETVEPWTSGDAAFECDEAGGCGTLAYKIDNWDQVNGMDGTYITPSGNTITISGSDGKSFDWASQFPVCKVIVKAGTGALVYSYGAAYEGVDLVGYEGKDISHVTFCYEVPVGTPITVTKTAVTSYTRQHFWDITKKVETENGYTLDGAPKIWLFTDGSGDESATWTVDATYQGYEDSGFNVSGTITVANTGSTDAVINSIADVLGETPVPIDCGEITFPYTLPEGETLVCTYSLNVDGKIAGPNVVTVTVDDDASYTAAADFSWGDPATVTDESVTIADSSDLFGDVVLGTVTAPENAQFIYTKDFAWADYGADGCGSYVYDNTATIIETDQTASASLQVGVQCYLYETAYAKSDFATPFIPTFANWGWTNKIGTGTYTWDLWAGAAQCDTAKGTNVGTVTVAYAADGSFTCTYNVASPFIVDETHVYAGKNLFPKDQRGRNTVAPGVYAITPGLSGDIYVIAHAVVGIPDPDFGPAIP
jgi:hypothetical protein